MERERGGHDVLEQHVRVSARARELAGCEREKGCFECCQQTNNDEIGKHERVWLLDSYVPRLYMYRTSAYLRAE